MYRTVLGFHVSGGISETLLLQENEVITN